MIISQRPEEIRAALALQSKCELRRVALRQCSASAGDVQPLKGPFSLRVSHDSAAHSVVDGILRIEVRFQIESHDAAESPLMVFEVHCSFALDYELDDRSFQPSAESIAAFKDGNAVFNCWSYAREFFQSIASRMELVPPPLPLLRIVPQAPEHPTPEEREDHARTTSRKRPSIRRRPQSPIPDPS
jgi:hypothetical protein